MLAFYRNRYKDVIKKQNNFAFLVSKISMNVLLKKQTNATRYARIHPVPTSATAGTDMNWDRIIILVGVMKTFRLINHICLNLLTVFKIYTI